MTNAILRSPAQPSTRAFTRTSTKTFAKTLEQPTDRLLGFTPVAPTDRPLSKAFDAFLDALFFSLEPSIDKTVSRRISQPDTLQSNHPYAVFDTPAYRRRGRCIPELDRTNR